MRTYFAIPLPPSRVAQFINSRCFEPEILAMERGDAIFGGEVPAQLIPVVTSPKFAMGAGVFSAPPSNI